MLRPVFDHGLPMGTSYREGRLVDEYKEVIKSVLIRTLSQDDSLKPFLADWGLRQEDGVESSNLVNDFIQSLILFEGRLAEAIPPIREWFDVHTYYNPYSLEEAEESVPHLALGDIIRHQVSGTTPRKVVVISPSYMKALSHILDETSEATVQAYLVWKLFQRHAINVKHEAVKPLLIFQNMLQGKAAQSSEERWETCVYHVNQGLGKCTLTSDKKGRKGGWFGRKGWILGHFWAEWHLPSKVKAFGASVISATKEEFVRLLETSPWMSHPTKHKAMEKGKLPFTLNTRSPAGLILATVRRMTQEIAYPTKNPNMKDAIEIDQRYASLEVSDFDYFTNVVSFAQAKNHARFAKLTQPASEREWDRTVDNVNVSGED